MTRTEIRDLMRVRKKDSFGTKRIIVQLRMLGAQPGAFTPQDIEAIRVLLKELKMIRGVAKEKMTRMH